MPIVHEKPKGKEPNMANMMDMLGKAAKKTKKTKKKEEMPVIELENTETNVNLMKDWLKHKKAEKTAQTSKKAAEEKLKPMAAEARKKFCIAHKYHSAIKIKVGDQEPVTASFQKKCSKISTDDQERLQEIYGDDYERCFRTITSIKLTDEAMTSIEEAAKEEKPSIINKLMDALGGPDEFFKVFEVSQEIQPRPYAFESAVADKEIAPKAQMAMEEELFKPQAASLSV